VAAFSAKIARELALRPSWSTVGPTNRFLQVNACFHKWPRPVASMPRSVLRPTLDLALKLTLGRVAPSHVMH
jgi:hypothetical protein